MLQVNSKSTPAFRATLLYLYKVFLFYAKLFDMQVANVYVHYVNKIIRKSQPVENLDMVITWLTGFKTPTILKHLESKTTFRAFFESAN